MGGQRPHSESADPAVANLVLVAFGDYILQSGMSFELTFVLKSNILLLRLLLHVEELSKLAAIRHVNEHCGLQF